MEVPMYAIREVMHCKPGKVRDMVNKFKSMNVLMQKMGYKPFSIFTDVSGVPFWTVVAVTEVDSLEQFFESMEKGMANEEARRIMTGYHDLVDSGRREIYRVET
jgi:hypothetical protein